MIEETVRGGVQRIFEQRQKFCLVPDAFRIDDDLSGTDLVREVSPQAFDVVGRYKDKWDKPRATSVAKLFADGYGNRVILSMDHQGCWVPVRPPRYVSFGTSYMDLYNFLPQLSEAGLTEEQIQSILVDNPRNLLTF